MQPGYGLLHIQSSIILHEPVGKRNLADTQKKLREQALHYKNISERIIHLQDLRLSWQLKTINPFRVCSRSQFMTEVSYLENFSVFINVFLYYFSQKRI
jgi:hypothetical protein